MVAGGGSRKAAAVGGGSSRGIAAVGGAAGGSGGGAITNYQLTVNTWLLKHLNNIHDFSLFLLNIASFSKNKDELETIF